MLSFITSKYAEANTLSSNPAIKNIIDGVLLNIVSPILGVLFLFSIVTFVYGIFKMILSQEDSDARTDGKNSILWSSVGMLIMISAYGIIRLIASTLAPVGVTDPFN